MPSKFSNYDPRAPYLKVEDPNGGAPVYLPIVYDSTGNAVVDGLVPSGLGTTTASTTDSTDKRYVTDAELALIALLTSGLVTGEQLLSSTPNVDVNTATASLLYTVPGGKTAIITRVVIRNPSTSLTTASVSFGFTSAAFADAIADATHTELTGATLFTALSPKVGAKVGAAAGTFKVKANILQGAAATVTIDVFGYLYG